MIWACLRERCPLNWDDWSCRSFQIPSREVTSQVRLSNDARKIHARFDDPNSGGACWSGPGDGAGAAGWPGRPRGRAFADRPRLRGERPGEAAGIVAGMIGGADSINDLDMLRHGAMPDLSSAGMSS